MKKSIMQTAWQIFRTTGKNFAECLKKAWAVFKLKQKMQNEIVEFAYEKADGSLRKAVGTLKDVAQFIKGSGNPANDKVFHYFDLDKAGFRCFKIENLVSIK